jgi:hypothetical protein
MNYSLKIEGEVEAALVCDVPGSLVSSRKDKILVHLAGIAGDRHYGYTFPSNGRFPMYPRRTEIANSRQVSIISTEEMQAVSELLGLTEILPEWMGANLIFSGIPALTYLPPSTRLTFQQGAVIIVHGENDPCINVGRIVQAQFPDRQGLDAALVKAAIHRRGVVGWIEHPGMISPGDRVTAEIPDQVLYSQFVNKPG